MDGNGTRERETLDALAEDDATREALDAVASIVERRGSIAGKRLA